MNCAKCHYEFCWSCLGHYRSYRHDPGMEQYCHIRKLNSVLIYGFFFVLFWVLKLLCLSSRGEPAFFSKDPILDRISGGESFFTRENFLVTLGTFVIINVYAFAVFILMVITLESPLRYNGAFPVICLELVFSILFAFGNPWLQYGAQIFFFEILLLLGLFFGFWISIATFVAGMVTLAVKIVFLCTKFGITAPFRVLGKFIMPSSFAAAEAEPLVEHAAVELVEAAHKTV